MFETHNCICVVFCILKVEYDGENEQCKTTVHEMNSNSLGCSKKGDDTKGCSYLVQLQTALEFCWMNFLEGKRYI